MSGLMAQTDVARLLCGKLFAGRYFRCGAKVNVIARDDRADVVFNGRIVGAVPLDMVAVPLKHPIKSCGIYLPKDRRKLARRTNRSARGSAMFLAAVLSMFAGAPKKKPSVAYTPLKGGGK